jgi:hypothetical protein
MMEDIKITTNLLRSAKLTWLIAFGMAVISSILFSLFYWKLELTPDKFDDLIIWSIAGIGAPILVLLLGAFAFEIFSLLFLFFSTIMFKTVNQRIGLIRSGVVLIILVPSLYYTALFYPSRSIKRDKPPIQMQQDSLKYLQGWKWKAPPDSIRYMVLLTENSTLDNCFPLTDELFRHAITAAGKIKGFKLLSPTSPDSLLAFANVEKAEHVSGEAANIGGVWRVHTRWGGSYQIIDVEITEWMECERFGLRPLSPPAADDDAELYQIVYKIFLLFCFQFCIMKHQ